MNLRVVISQILLVLSIIASSLICIPESLALEPQNDVSLTQNAPHVYTVLIPIQPDTSSTQFTISLPSFLRSGYLAQDGYICTDDSTSGILVCSPPSGGQSGELVFRWDTHDVIEGAYCQTVEGQKQSTQPWIIKYSFASSFATPYAHEISLSNLSTENSDLSRTYADLASAKGYIVLWSKGNVQGSNIPNLFLGGVDSIEWGSGEGSYDNTSYQPLIGSFANVYGNSIQLFLVNTEKKTILLDSARLTICSVSNIQNASFDQEVIVNYLTSNGDESKHENFSPLRFAYESLGALTSPTLTPSQTPTPTNTPTSTPTPTVQSIVVTSTQASPTPTISNATTQINTEITQVVVHTPTMTCTPTPSDEGDVSGITPEHANENEVGDDQVQQGQGQVLGAKIKRDKESASWMTIIMIISLGIGAFIVFLVLKIWGKSIFRHKAMDVIVGFFILGLCTCHQVQASPVVLAKVTGPRSYIARSTAGWGELTIHAPLFYFEGVKPGGRIVLSSTTDGTGRISLGNGGNFSRFLPHWSSTVNFWMVTPPTSPTNCNGAQDLPPQELPSQHFTVANTEYDFGAVFRGYCPTGQQWQISDLYLLYFPPEPSPTPTNTPTPTPTTVAPFLDLPWDYRGEGVTFTEAALAMTSYFDHEYPTLSAGGIIDPSDMIIYSSSQKTSDTSYSSHDGYDYGNASHAHYGGDQYAAAAGIASLHTDCGACGNAIHINHGNGFQTRYYHLDPQGLIISKPGITVFVSAGQKIGEIGFTGRIIPASRDGAHVHFMVIYDKDQDGEFDDNIPDGVVDPYGWQGTGADPWETATFEYPAKVQRTGMKSSYLWKYPLAQKNQSVGVEGGEIQNEKVKVTIPALTLPNLVDFFIRLTPQQKIDDKIESIGAVSDITATDGGGIAIKRFSQPITITFDFSNHDVSGYIPESLSIYSSADGALWQKEQTLIDHDTKSATTAVDHLTYFALMGELTDTVPPQTTATLEGLGSNTIFRSSVTITLHGADTAGLVDYTLFKLDTSDWAGYQGPISVDTEGTHTLEYFSADKMGNVENAQTYDFVIDKTAPEITFMYDTHTSEFLFSALKDESEVLNIAEGSVIAEDKGGNTHEMTYTQTIAGKSTVLSVTGHSYKGVASEVSDVYVITQSGEAMYEYLQSKGDETRVIPYGDSRLIIAPDGEITETTLSTPLQLVTSDGRLKIYE